MLRKIVRLFLAAILLVLVMIPVTARAEEEPSHDVYFQQESWRITISPTKSDGDFQLFSAADQLEANIPWDRDSAVSTITVIGDIYPVSMENWFRNFENLNTIEGLSKIHTSYVTSMEELFSGDKSLTSLDLSGFDTANVQNMKYMFDGCEALKTLKISGFNTSAVTSMYRMFNDCENLTALDVSRFDTSACTDMGSMFGDCELLTTLNVSGFDTSKVTDMSGMFDGCKNLTQLDVGRFDTSGVTDMSMMFRNCINLTKLDVSNFNTSGVVRFGEIFSYCKKLTALDVSHFDTSKAEKLTQMFEACESLAELDLSGFNTENCTSFGLMFDGCRNLKELDLSSFDTSKATSFTYMFCNCEKLEKITVRCGSDWKSDIIEYGSQMFFNCQSLVGGDGTKYTDGRDSIDFARIDGGEEAPGYFTAAPHQWIEQIDKATFESNGRIYPKCRFCGEEIGDDQVPLLKVSNVRLSKTSFKYTGKAIKPEVTVANASETLSTDVYTVTYSNNKNAGTATVTVTLQGDYYEGTKTLTFKINKAKNPLTVKVKTATVKFAALKKKNQTVKRSKVLAVSKNQGKVTYVKAGGNNKITINKTTGKVTVKKGLKKGTYKVKVKVKAAGTKNYKALTKTVTFKIIVK